MSGDWDAAGFSPVKRMRRILSKAAERRRMSGRVFEPKPAPLECALSR
jgi:hypothetical protein